MPGWRVSALFALGALLAGGLLVAGCAVPAGQAPVTPAAATGARGDVAASAATPLLTSPAPRLLETVRVAETAAIAYAPVYVAEARGYYRELGLELTFENFAGGADVVPALARGDVDVNLGAISAGTFNAFERGLDIRIVAPMGILPRQDSALPLLARRDLVESGAVHSPADLRGRRVAVNTRGAIVEYLLTRALERDGLALTDVEMVTLPFPDHASAFATGAIDAAITAEPFATRALKQGVAAKLLAEIAPLRMTTVVMYSGHFIREREEAARRWMVATLRGVRDIQGPELGVSYPDRLFTPENLAAFQQHTGASEAVLRDQVPYTWDPNLEIQLDLILDEQRVLIANGTLQLAQPIPPEQLVDDRFVRYAREVLGPIPR
ncbi:MAG TPA: ABC transporter substrate-binding protein [Chloroflexota bacterium]|nr:ABC transporter substrate-binding protein [Chloroflexota bacterium]